MKKLGFIAMIIGAMIIGSVAYKDATTTTLTYTEAGSTELHTLTIPQGDAWDGWEKEDCYLHTCYEPITVAGNIVPNVKGKERYYELSTGDFWGRKSLLIKSKKIHIVSVS